MSPDIEPVERAVGAPLHGHVPTFVRSAAAKNIYSKPFPEVYRATPARARAFPSRELPKFWQVILVG
jgi:hypothetical protein